MSDYILSCCSTADLSQEHFDKIGVHYVCFHFNMDGKEYPDDLGKSMSFAEFYKRIADGAEPTTSQVNVGQFKEYFTEFLKDGKVAGKNVGFMPKPELEAWVKGCMEQ